MKRYFCSIIIVCITVSFFGQTVADRLHERIYVQTDKHFYLAGEPVLLKVLTTNAENIPIAFSKIAYVELIDNAASLIQVKIELTHGTGAGVLLLPADIPTGYYRLIAYTHFMRNEGAAVFFEKHIAALNTFQSGYNPSEAGAEGGISTGSNPVDDNTGRDLSLQPDKTTYGTRQRGELTLSGLPENIHTLSVSVAGKDIVAVDESNVSLFKNNLTKKSTTFTGEFLPEYEGHIISGQIIDNQTGEVAISHDQYIASAITFPGEEIRFFSGQNTESGNVHFITSGVSGRTQVSTVVFFADEKYRIDLLSPFVPQHIHKQTPLLHVDTSHYRKLLDRSVALQVFRYFAEEKPLSDIVQRNYFKMQPSWAYPLDDYTRFPTMQEVFIEFIAGARFRRNAGKQEISILYKRGESYFYGQMPLVLLDGVPITDHEEIFRYDPLAVEHINVYYGPYMMGGYRFDGIVELITYRRMYQGLTLNRSTQIVTYYAPQAPYSFDTPDYSSEANKISRLPDGRHTLLWNPDVKTEGKNSIILPFDTSDLTGEFQATVEGITKEGEIISVTSSFKVE